MALKKYSPQVIRVFNSIEKVFNSRHTIKLSEIAYNFRLFSTNGLNQQM